MRIELSASKDRADREKHGLSSAFASELDWDAALVWLDDRFNYDELRMIALAPRPSTLYYVALWSGQKLEGLSAFAVPIVAR